MQFVRSLLSKFRVRRSRSALEAEMHEEMRSHLQHRTEEYVASGLSLEEATRAAAVEFGPVSAWNEEAREARGWSWRDNLVRNLRYAHRQLARSKLFSFVTIGSLSLFLGINTAVFAALDALVIHPLPFAGSDRIVEVFNAFPKVNIEKFSSNVGQYLDFKAHVTVFDTAALWDTQQDVLTGADHPALLMTATGTAEIFELLGLHPVAGHFFDATNSDPITAHVVVLTEAFWTNHFNRDPHVVGKLLQLNREPYEIIGVAPNTIRNLAPQVEAIRPLLWDHHKPVSRTGFSPTLLARLKPGETSIQAQAEADSLEKAYYTNQAPAGRAFFEQTGQTVKVDLLSRQRSHAFVRPLWLLQIAAIAVLLVAFANILSLFIAQINGREMEFAARAALGASSLAIVCQLAAESAIVGVLGLLGGVTIAWIAVEVANPFLQVLSPGIPAFHLSFVVIIVSIVVTIILTALITLATGARILHTSIGSQRERANRSQSASKQARRLATCFIVGQIAFSLIITITAALLVLSFSKAMAAPSGFNPDHLLSLRIPISKAQEKVLPRQLEEAFQKLRGVECCVVTATPYYRIPPYNVSMPLGAVRVRGEETASNDSLPSAYYCGVTANYAEILGLHLIKGRWFSESDIASGRCAVVDEKFWKRHFNDTDPIGQKLVIDKPAPSDDRGWLEIIGVVGNVRHNGIDDKTAQPVVYLSRDEAPFFETGSIIAKTIRQPEEVFPLLRKAVESVDPQIPVYDMKTLRGVMAESIQDRQAMMLMMVALAGASVFLAALGTYGSLSYDISRRFREIGIRTAVGASRWDIVKLLFSDVRKRASLGIVIGLAGALAGHRLVANLLYEVTATNAYAFLASAGFVLLACCVACLAPALRAIRLNTVEALRAD